VQERLQEVFKKYKGERGELIPVLQDIQDVLGYIPEEAMIETAGFFGIPDAVVYGVVTFYAQFYLVPQGKHKIKVCLGTACHVRNAGKIMDAIENKLGIKAGETTEDMLFSLERVACFGSCALGPVVTVNNKYYGKMTVGKMLELLKECAERDQEKVIV